MAMLTIKSQTEDVKRVEGGGISDDQALSDNKFGPIKSVLREAATGLLFFLGSSAAGLIILYGVGLWVDR